MEQQVVTALHGPQPGDEALSEWMVQTSLAKDTKDSGSETKRCFAALPQVPDLAPVASRGHDWIPPDNANDPIGVVLVRGSQGPSDEGWTLEIDGHRCHVERHRDGRQKVPCCLPPPCDVGARIHVETRVRPVAVAVRLEHEALQPERVDVYIEQFVSSEERSDRSLIAENDTPEVVHACNVTPHRTGDAAAHTQLVLYPFHAPSQTAIGIMMWKAANAKRRRGALAGAVKAKHMVNDTWKLWEQATDPRKWNALLQRMSPARTRASDYYALFETAPADSVKTERPKIFGGGSTSAAKALSDTLRTLLWLAVSVSHAYPNLTNANERLVKVRDLLIIKGMVPERAFLEAMVCQHPAAMQKVEDLFKSDEMASQDPEADQSDLIFTKETLRSVRMEDSAVEDLQRWRDSSIEYIKAKGLEEAEVKEKINKRASLLEPEFILDNLVSKIRQRSRLCLLVRVVVTELDGTRQEWTFDAQENDAVLAHSIYAGMQEEVLEFEILAYAFMQVASEGLDALSGTSHSNAGGDSDIASELSTLGNLSHQDSWGSVDTDRMSAAFFEIATQLNNSHPVWTRKTEIRADSSPEDYYPDTILKRKLPQIARFQNLIVPTLRAVGDGGIPNAPVADRPNGRFDVGDYVDLVLYPAMKNASGITQAQLDLQAWINASNYVKTRGTVGLFGRFIVWSSSTTVRTIKQALKAVRSIIVSPRAAAATAATTAFATSLSWTGMSLVFLTIKGIATARHSLYVYNKVRADVKQNRERRRQAQTEVRGSPIQSALLNARSAASRIRNGDYANAVVPIMRRFEFVELREATAHTQASLDALATRHSTLDWERAAQPSALALLPPSDTSATVYEVEDLRGTATAAAIANVVGDGVLDSSATSTAVLAARSAFAEMLRTVKAAWRTTPLQGRQVLESPEARALQLAKCTSALLRAAFSNDGPDRNVTLDDNLWTCLPGGVAARLALNHFEHVLQLDAQSAWSKTQKRQCVEFGNALVSEATAALQLSRKLTYKERLLDASAFGPSAAIDAARTFARIRLLASGDPLSLLQVGMAYHLVAHNSEWQTEALVATLDADTFRDQHALSALATALQDHRRMRRVTASTWAARRADVDAMRNWQWRRSAMNNAVTHVEDLVDHLERGAMALSVSRYDASREEVKHFYSPVSDLFSAVPTPDAFAPSRLSNQLVCVQAFVDALRRVATATASSNTTFAINSLRSNEAYVELIKVGDKVGIARHPLTLRVCNGDSVVQVHDCATHCPSKQIATGVQKTTNTPTVANVVAATQQLAKANTAEYSAAWHRMKVARALAYNADRYASAYAYMIGVLMAAVPEDPRIERLRVEAPSVAHSVAAALGLALSENSNEHSLGMHLCIDTQDPKGAAVVLRNIAKVMEDADAKGCRTAPLCDVCCALAAHL